MSDQPKRPLPKLADLHRDPLEAFKNDEFKLLLNQPVNKAWIKNNKYADNAEYLPIDKVEFLLDRIFQNWKIEILSVTPIFNSVLATIRLHYQHPVTGEWLFHDGGGAKELQTKSGTGPVKPDLSNISSNACAMAVPIAISTALKDAADHLGTTFGRNLNRKDTIQEFTGSYGKAVKAGPAAEEPPLTPPPPGDPATDDLPL